MKQQRLLLVEDEKLIARAYQLALEKEGYLVDLVYDGQQALSAMDTCTYDLILLDLILPHIDGFELMQRKNTQGACKNTPIIVLSNLGQETDIAKAKELGAVNYLVKADHSLNDVLRIVKRTLEKHQDRGNE
ncbi:response regulator [Candidatus Uhrbacteria bacterium]|nr:response regulator [Candidatus Uhrbacteria bacterium]